MRTLTSVVFICLSQILAAQHFNRSILDGQLHDEGDVLIVGEHTFLLMDDVAKGRPVLYKFDEAGNTLGKVMLSWNSPRFMWSEDLKLSNDGNLIAHGRYDNCDVVDRTGNFFAVFDQNLNQLSFSAVSDSLGGYGRWLSHKSSNYILNYGVVVHLDSTFQPGASDSLHDPRMSILDYSILLREDSVLVHCTNSGTNYYLLWDLEADTAYAVLDSSTTYHDLNDTLMYTRQWAANTIQLIDKRSLLTVGTRDLGTHINHVPGELHWKNGHLFIRDSSHYHVVRLSDWALMDVGELHSEVGDWRVFPGDSAIAVASHHRNHMELEVRKYQQTPAPVFEGLEFEAIHHSSIVSHITTFSDSSYFLTLNGYWDLRVTNNGTKTLDSLKFVITDWLSAHCHWSDEVFRFDSLNLAPGDSVEVRVNTTHAQRTSGNLELKLEILPVSANGNIIKDNSLVTGTHSTHVSLDEAPALSWKLYPNPVHDQLILHISSQELLEVEVYDLTGKLHKRDEISQPHGEVVFKMDDLPAGTYVIKLQQGSDRSVHKVMKL